MPSMNVDEKFSYTLGKLKRMTQQKKRIPALETTYHLGDLIVQYDSYRSKTKALKGYYREMALRVYDLFEDDPNRIIATRELTAHMIKNMKRAEVNLVKERMLQLAGARTSEEEVVNLDLFQ